MVRTVRADTSAVKEIELPQSHIDKR